MEGREVSRIYIALHQFLNARQPRAHRAGFGQGGRCVVGEDAPGLGRVCGWQIVGTAGQLSARLGVQNEAACLGRRTARQQIGVSEVGQEGQVYSLGQVQGVEEFLPEQMMVVVHILRPSKQQPRPRAVAGFPDEVAVAAHMHKE